MLPRKLYSLYLSKSRIVFRDEFGQNLDNTEEIGDYAIPIIHHEDNSPDYMIRGNFRSINNNLRREFIINNKGPHILLITGVPKEKSRALDNFKFKGCIYMTYYEDQIKGTLFQVLPKSASYIGVSKSLGVKQF